MKRKRVCQSLWAAALVVLSAGCVKEPYPGGGTGGSSGFTLTAVAESMSPEGVITRASDPKTAAECEIRTLHVFLFGPDGNYLGTREGHRIFQGYQQIGSPTSRSGGASGMQGTARLFGQTLGTTLVALIFRVTAPEVSPLRCLMVAIGFALTAAVVSSLRLSQATPVKKRG